MEIGAISGKDKGKGRKGKDKGKEKKGVKTKSKFQKGDKADIRWQKKNTWNGNQWYRLKVIANTAVS